MEIGRTIGPYRIVEKLGEGGMGEVYRARDSQLGRDVAIKILPEAFANDAERLARFDREARTLATLNHANIAHIYGLESSASESGPRERALVMELVEGEDLAQRLVRGSIPIDEALPIARQITDALEAAHEQGIIHRDLKPANIKVRPDGTVKVLDFGLAKALERGSETGDQASGNTAAQLANSPTITSPAAMTMGGMILGTAAYMSPEQARGRRVDKRADIWAFGCVLYEMLSGRNAFAGDDVTETIVAVMSREPEWTALPANTPASIRRLLRRCLTKNGKLRLPDIAAARLDIDDAAEEPAADRSTTAPRRTSPAPSIVPWAVAAIATVAAVTMFTVWAPWRRPAPESPIQLNAELGQRLVLASGQGRAGSVVLSPDGKVIAFVAIPEGDSPARVFVRPLDQLQPAALSGTEGATNPFFSPDGRWIGFFADGRLKKVATSGGPVANVCDAPEGRGAAWSDDGTIVFSPLRTGAPLMRVSDGGGEPQVLTTLAEGEVTHRWPQILPGGGVLLYTANAAPVGFDTARIVVQQLPNGTPKTVIRDGYYGRYLPSGHLIYMHEGTLFAARFSVERLEVIGTPQPIIENLANNAATGGAEIGFSSNGTFVYVPGRTITGTGPIFWGDRQRKLTPLRAESSVWSGPRFSPDGNRLAYSVLDRGLNDVWIYDWTTDRQQRQTVGAGNNESPVWSPDGQRVVFSSTRGRSSGSNLFWQRADSASGTQQLTDTDTLKRPDSWHPDGRSLLYTEIGKTSTDVMLLRIEGSEQSGWKPGTPTPFLNSRFGELNSMFSPDGRWVAYEADDAGQYDVYVMPFPGPGPRVQISTRGGAWPTWSKTKPELFFVQVSGGSGSSGPPAAGEAIMVVPYRIEKGTFVAEKAEVWADLAAVQRGGLHQRSIDLHPDGTRFALDVVGARPEGAGGSSQVTIIFNFFELLKQRMPI